MDPELSSKVFDLEGAIGLLVDEYPKMEWAKQTDLDRIASYLGNIGTLSLELRNVITQKADEEITQLAWIKKVSGIRDDAAPR
jgi:hypothetical protein